MCADSVPKVTNDIQALTDAYLHDERGHADGRAWLMLNMIASIDGAIAIDGLSGELGNEADFAVFKTLRSLADVVLVAAGTARSEGYRVPTIDDETAARRAACGQARLPVIAVVTRSLRLDLDSPLFATPSYRPIVVTVDQAPEEARAATEAKADVVVAGIADVDLPTAVTALSNRVGPMILVEGGPTLNGQLATADLFDELCVTTSPTLVGGNGGRMLASGDAHRPRQFRIDRARTAGGLLFTRYLRDVAETDRTLDEAPAPLR